MYMYVFLFFRLLPFHGLALPNYMHGYFFRGIFYTYGRRLPEVQSRHFVEKIYTFIIAAAGLPNIFFSLFNIYYKPMTYLVLYICLPLFSTYDI